MEQKNQTTERQNMVLADYQTTVANDETEIDLVELFFVMLHHWRSFLLAILLGATLMGAYHTYFVKPSYSATAEFYITSSDSVISLTDLNMGRALTADYQNIIKSRAVLNKVIQDLGLNIDYRSLSNLIKVDNPSDTHIIDMTVTTSDLTLSRDIVNDLLTVSIERIYQIIGTNEPTIIDYSEAEAVKDVTPSIIRHMAIGGLIGAVLVAAFVVLRSVMDSTIKSDDDVERYLHLPVLAAVPYYRQ